MTRNLEMIGRAATRTSLGRNPPLRSGGGGEEGSSEIPKAKRRGRGERAIAEIRAAYGCSPTPRMLALSGPWGPRGERVGDARRARRREAAGEFPGMRRDGRTNGRPSVSGGQRAWWYRSDDINVASRTGYINIMLTPSFLRKTCPNGRNCCVCTRPRTGYGLLLYYTGRAH